LRLAGLIVARARDVDGQENEELSTSLLSQK
jgi:hypothetical protein